MALDILKERGTPLEKQQFDWRDIVQIPYSKLDDDAFTRVRVILMNGIESNALRFGHAIIDRAPALGAEVVWSTSSRRRSTG